LLGLGDPQAFQRFLAVGILVIARISPLVLLAPWLSLRAFSPVIRLAIVCVLAAALLPCALGSAAVTDLNLLALSEAAVRELVVGAVFALAACLPFYTLYWAGQLADTWRGASMDDLPTSVTGERASPLGELYLLTAVVLFFSLGGHCLALSAFADTLSSFPIGRSLSSGGLSAALWGSIKLFSSAFAFAAIVAAPVGAVLAITEIGFGLIGRVAPEIANALATVSLRAALGLVAALFAIFYGLSLLGPTFHEAIQKAYEIVRQLSR
jgi:type III secretory pathway component EscT